MKTIILLLAIACLTGCGIIPKPSTKPKPTAPPAPPGLPRAVSRTVNAKPVPIVPTFRRVIAGRPQLLGEVGRPMSRQTTPTHSAGFGFGGSESAGPGGQAFVILRYSNFDSFGDNHLWTGASAVIQHAAGQLTTGNLLTPGAVITMRTHPISGLPPETNTFVMESNSVAIPFGWFAQLQLSFSIPASDANLGNLLCRGIISGVDTRDASGGEPVPTGPSEMEHLIRIVGGMAIARAGGSVSVTFVQPANTALTLAASGDLATWIVAETFPAVPQAEVRMRMYPAVGVTRFFRLQP